MYFPQKLTTPPQQILQNKLKIKLNSISIKQLSSLIKIIAQTKKNQITTLMLLV